MKAWSRWQDYATMVFGVLLFASAARVVLRRSIFLTKVGMANGWSLSPFVYPGTLFHIFIVSAYMLGVLLVVAGIVAASTREPRRSVILNAPGLVAVLIFITALAFEFLGATDVAWTFGITAIATVLVGATLRLSPKEQHEH